MKLIYTTLLAIFFNILIAKAQEYTIIVSLDGFRWDYTEMYDTPNLDKMAEKGVKAVMRPSYPSSTFPNHFTLITGLIPDHHGIINNTFWDKTNKRRYSMGDSLTRNDISYYKGETIWATAQNQGVKTASLYWVGSDLPINDNYPAQYKEWSNEPRLTFAERIDTALSWLDKTDIQEIPKLITIYMDEPDGKGHRFGPKSQETCQQVMVMDSLIGVLMTGIEKLPISEQVNLIITSDHGMTDISPDRFININDYLSTEMYQRALGSNPTFIFADEEKIDSIYQILSEIPHIDVYKKQDIPLIFNYGSNPNMGDLIVVPELGWQFGFRPSSAKGAHGFALDNTDMHVMFRAYGPDFEKGYTAKNFDNTAIYPLLCYLLQIQPASNDGDINQIKDMFTPKKKK